MSAIPVESPDHVKGLLHTCLDETGHWKDPKVIFGGWISDAHRWFVFQQEWFTLLDEFPGIHSIHMTDLMVPAAEKKYQDHTFSDSKPRQKLINKCVDVIHQNVIAAAGCGVDCEAYDRVVSKASKKRIGGDAHIFVFRRVMKHIVEALETNKWPYATGLIFDDNNAYGRECYRHYTTSREAHPLWKKSFGSITFADDEWYPPLQAADMFAWFLRKQNEPKYDGRFDATIKRLTKGIPGRTPYYDEKALRELNNQMESGNAIPSEQK